MARIVAVHSDRGGTGKSLVTAGLAALAAADGLRVAVIDLALQSPTQHALFGLTLAAGSPNLSSYLEGRDQIEKAAYDLSTQAVTEAGGLLLVVPATPPDVDGDLLSRGYDLGLLADACTRLIDKARLDLLFLDTHPGVSNESALAVALADTAVLVVRPDAARTAGAPGDPDPATPPAGRQRLLVVTMVSADVSDAELRARMRERTGLEATAVLPYREAMAGFDGDLPIGRRFFRREFSAELAAVLAAVDGLAAPGGERR